MKEWLTQTIGELCDSGGGKVQTGPFGSQLHESDYSETGTPVVMPKDILDGRVDESSIARVSDPHIDRLRRHKLAKGDIVYGRRGDIGRQALVRDENVGWLCGTGCLRIRLGNSSVSPEFLHRYLNVSQIIRWIEGHAIGATMANLNTNILRRVPVTFPTDAGNQQKITAILAAYDALIDNNKWRVLLLERLAQNIYREWFVRRRFPGHECVKFIKGTPQTWQDTTFGKFCMLKRGYDLPDKRVVPGNYPVVASTSIKTYHNEFKVRPPVITTGRSGSLGTVLMVNCNAWPLNTALYVKNFFGNSPYLVFYTLKNMGLENFNSGAGVPTLNRNHINGIKIAVPDKDLQERFDSAIAPFHKKMEQLTKANALLARARDTLLPRLISGKLSVENLDIRFPACMAKELKNDPTTTTHA
jgi:type I restriction enzyme S subunit